MGRYKVKIYTNWYKNRQQKANADHALCYIEHHLNSSGQDKNKDGKADLNNIDYCMVLLVKNSSKKTVELATKYCQLIKEKFNIKLYNNTGLKYITGLDRGYGNICFLKIPALLLEPLFLTNKDVAGQFVNNEDYIVNKLADCLVQTITDCFPKGGLIGFSVGHKFRPIPYDKDKGANVEFDIISTPKATVIGKLKKMVGIKEKVSEPVTVTLYEGDITEKVINKTKELLENIV